MTREERAIQILEQRACCDVPSNEMILERARQASKDLRKRFKEDLEQEPCDEYGNYKYPSDIELTEPNTATSIPCGDLISRQIISDYVESHIQEINTGYGDLNEHTNRILRMIMEYIDKLPSVNPQEPKTGHWIKKDGYSDCSECGSHIVTEWDYCPKCGAKMVEPQESEG